VGLAGLERSDVARGAVLAASNLEPRSVLDVEFSPHDSAVATLRRRTPVRAHIGAAEILGTLVFERIPAQGETVRAQLRLRAPTVAFAGARFVVRRPSPKDLIGGGTVARTTAGSAPAAGDDGVAARVLAALAAAGIAGAAAAQVGAVANVAEPLAGETLEGLCTDGRAFRLTRPAAFVAATAVDALLARVVAALETSEAGAPWLLGATSLRLAREFDVAEAELVRALALLADEGRLAHRGGYYATIAFVPRLQPEQGAFFERELVADPAQPYVPVPLDALVAAIRASHVIGISQAFDTLVASGAAVKVGGDVYRGEQIAGVRRAVAEVARREGRIAPSALRDALGTSRKYVVPLLEWLDASGVTVRSGDARVLRQQAAHAEP
jgi:selenocysteine-specific elongation factor